MKPNYSKRRFSTAFLLACVAILSVTMVSYLLTAPAVPIQGEIPKTALRTTANPYEVWNTTVAQPVDGHWGHSWDVAVDTTDNIYAVATLDNDTTGEDQAHIFRFLPNGNLDWQDMWNTTTTVEVEDVAVDSDGNAYMVGVSEPAFNRMLMLAQYLPDGTRNWTLITNPSAEAYGVTVDTNDNIFVSGMDVTTLYLAKYLPNSTMVWDTTWNGGHDAQAVTVDPSGAIYCVGGTALWGSTNSDFVLVKFDSSGNELWNVTWGGTEDDRGTRVEVDSSGGIVCTAQTDSYGNPADVDLVLLKFHPNGTLAWNITLGPPDFSSYSSGLVVDPSDAITIVYSNNVSARMVLEKYSPDGVQIWRYQRGTGNWGTDLAMDSNGGLFCAGLEGSETLLVKFFESPDPPILTATVITANSPGIVQLDWAASFRATSYYVFRNTSEITTTVGLSPIATVVSPTQSFDTNLSAGTYYYAIVAVGSAGNSSLSNCVSVTIEPPSGGIPGFGHLTMIISLVLFAALYYDRQRRKIL